MVKLAMGKKVQAVLNFHRLVTFFQAVVFWGSLRYADYKWNGAPGSTGAIRSSGESENN